MAARSPIRTIPTIATRAGVATLLASISLNALPALAQQSSGSPEPGLAQAASSPMSPADGALDGWLVMERFGQAPDGSTTELDFGRRQVWLVRPDGSDLHELSPGEPAGGKASPDISPDRTRVAFFTWDPVIQVWEVDVDGDDPRLVSADCSGVESECAEYDPAWSPDGSRLAVVRQEVVDGVTWTHIAVRDLASGERMDLASTRVAWDAGSSEDGYLAQPTWSPDGERIAYHRTPRVEDGYPFGVSGWIVDLAGGEPVRLRTPGGRDAADLDWSPDGSRIVYSTIGLREFEGIETPPAQIVSVRPDGSDPLVLCDASRPDDGGCWAPTWMPDGQQVLFYGYQTWNLVGADGTGNAPIDAAALTWFGTEPGQGFGYSATWLPAG